MSNDNSSQNLRMMLLAMLMLLMVSGAAYVGAYLYLGVPEDSADIGGSFTIRRFPSDRVATVFEPLGTVEALVMRRRVWLLGPRPNYLLIEEPALSTLVDEV